MSSSYRKRFEEIKRHIMNEYSLLPEFIDGLTSIHEETEDYTCLTLKKLAGKREKGRVAAAQFRHGIDKENTENCSQCPPE